MSGREAEHSTLTELNLEFCPRVTNCSLEKAMHLPELRSSGLTMETTRSTRSLPSEGYTVNAEPARRQTMYGS